MVGEKLKAAGLITDAQLQTALREAKAKGERIGDAIVRLGYCTREQIEAALK